MGGWDPLDWHRHAAARFGPWTFLPGPVIKLIAYAWFTTVDTDDDANKKIAIASKNVQKAFLGDNFQSSSPLVSPSPRHHPFDSYHEASFHGGPDTKIFQVISAKICSR